jgi:hypothetical protein
MMNLDPLGLILLAGSSTAIILAMCFGGLTLPWHSGSMIALWVVGSALFLIFALQQGFGIGTRQPVFPVAMMKDARVVIIFLNECCASTACFLPVYFIPL